MFRNCMRIWAWHLLLQWCLIQISQTKEGLEEDQTPFTTGADMFEFLFYFFFSTSRYESKMEEFCGKKWPLDERRNCEGVLSLCFLWSPYSIELVLYFYLFIMKLFIQIELNVFLRNSAVYCIGYLIGSDNRISVFLWQLSFFPLPHTKTHVVRNQN